MLQGLLNELNRYANGLITWRDLETWLVSHLQAILDSGDSRAIELANEMDGRLVDLGEHLTTEEEFRQSVEALVRIGETIVVPVVATPVQVGVVNEATVASDTIIEHWRDLGPVTNVRLEHSFA
jgi:hypothetical protein